MKLEILDGELDKQETKDIIKMLKRKGTFDFGLNRTYKYVGRLKIRIENTLLSGSEKFRNVEVKLIYK